MGNSSILFVLVVAVSALAGCKTKTEPGPPVAFDDASVLLPDRMSPKICAGQSNGKRASVIGYARWVSGTVAHVDSNGDGVAHIEITEKSERTPKQAAVPLNVKMKTLFGGFIDKPELENASSGTKGYGAGKTSETTGTLTDESMKLHLADDTIANNTVKLRVTVEVEGNDGHCNLNLVDVRRAP